MQHVLNFEILISTVRYAEAMMILYLLSFKESNVMYYIDSYSYPTAIDYKKS